MFSGQSGTVSGGPTSPAACNLSSDNLRMGVEKGEGDEKNKRAGKRRGLQADMVAAKRKVWVMRGERARARKGVWRGYTD